MKDFERGDLVDIYVSALANGAAGKPSVEFDLAEFLHHLAEIDMPEEDKLQVLGTVRDVLTTWIDVGFGVHSIQQACGQISENAAGLPVACSEVLDLGSTERTRD